MLRHLLFMLSVNTLTEPALADSIPLTGDCIVFEHADQQGASWIASADGPNASAANLDNGWQDLASSVWLRTGFVLEAYPEPGFKGKRLDVSRDLLVATEASGGASVNLHALNFNDQLSSYRCRRAGEDRILTQGSVLWLEGAEYGWLSGGNHPDHKTLQMKTEGADLIIIVHADQTYGTHRQDFRVNLSTSQVHGEFVGAGFAKGQTDFDLFLASMRPDFKLTLQDLIQHLQILAQGYAAYPPKVEPPKPELQSLIAYLQRFAL